MLHQESRQSDVGRSMRSIAKTVTVLVPCMAFGAATMFALGADQIVSILTHRWGRSIRKLLSSGPPAML